MSSKNDHGKTQFESSVFDRRKVLLGSTTLAATSALGGSATVKLAQAQPQPAPAGRKPNILMIMADDIGWFNSSAYNRGMMGYRTPNIDRIAKEGALFTDWYGEQSCTAGRAAFITGQSPIRTGLTKVGLPGRGHRPARRRPERRGSPEDRSATRPDSSARTISATATNILPTVHGFDEFFGNLYHLNAEEEPENPDYPKDPEFRKKFGPRGVLQCKASDTDDATVDPASARSASR